MQQPQTLSLAVCLQRKVLCDRSGQPVATLTNRLLSIRDAVQIHSADGSRVLAEVKRQLVSLTHGARINVTGLQLPLEVHGDFRGRNFEVRAMFAILPCLLHETAPLQRATLCVCKLCDDSAGTPPHTQARLQQVLKRSTQWLAILILEMSSACLHSCQCCVLASRRRALGCPVFCSQTMRDAMGHRGLSCVACV